MSGQPEAEAEVTRSLEDLFLSREFGQPLPVLAEPEDLFLAREFGGRRGRVRARDLRGTPFLATVVAAGWRGHPARNRTLAAVSGVAAAALVVAGFAAGTTHRTPTGVSALGSAKHSKGGEISGGGGSSLSSIVPGATTVVSGTGGGGSTAFFTARTVVIELPPGTTLTVVPTPSPASAPPNTVAPPAGAPAPTTGAPNPLAPVATVVTNTTGTVGGAASALASADPSAAPVTTVLSNLGSSISAAIV
jgi:hypothetical protein